MKFKQNELERVRHILGSEVFRSKKTGKEYLVVYNKRGKSKLVELKKVV